MPDPKLLRFRKDRVRRARREAGLSQSQLAARIGAHTTSISDWERGRNEPSARHIVGIARETGKKVEFFFSDDDEEEDPDAVIRKAASTLAQDGHYDLAADLLSQLAQRVSELGERDETERRA